MPKDFWKELDQRLDENQRLSHGGIPTQFQPIAAWLGLYPWQSLLWLSLGTTWLLVLVLRQEVIEIVERILLIY